MFASSTSTSNRRIFVHYLLATFYACQILMTLFHLRRFFSAGLGPAYMSVQDAPRNVVPFMPPTLSYFTLA
jgi:hypothetical protein